MGAALAEPARDDFLKVDAAWVRSLAISPNGETVVVSGGLDGKVHVARRHKGKLTLRDTIKEHRGPVADIVFAPDGRRFVTAGEDKSVRIWNTATAKLEHDWELPAPVLGVAFAPDNRHVLTANGNGTVYVFRLTANP
jgi:WD40 repeat protein